MSKFNLVVAILFLLLISSCKKSEVEQQQDFANSEDFSISEVKLLTLSQQKSPESIKQVFNLLSNSEKTLYWKRHLQIVLKDDIISNDPEKTNLIKELISLLKPSVFDSKSVDHNVFIAYEIQNWRKNALNVFTEEQLYEILSENRQNVSTSQVVKNPLLNTYDEFIPDETVSCYCNAGSTGFGCKLVTIGTGDIIRYGQCEAPTSHPCTASSSGCGWFWMQSCNGAHCNYG